MHKDFKHVAKKFGHYAPRARVLSDLAWSKVAQSIQVVFPAGGESKRLRGVMKKGYNKVTMPLPNGDTMLEYNIRMYRDAGIRDIILLVANSSDSVRRIIGDGSTLNVRVTYSKEPEEGLAKGGAIRLALEEQAIDTSKYMIVHNAGDIFFGYPGNIPREIVSHHLAFEKMGSIATLVTAPMSLVQGSSLQIKKGYVTHINFEPYLPMPYHTNATIFSPSVYPYFLKLFPLGQKAEFETVLFPYLALRKKLTAMKIDNKYSLQVKTEKQWQQLLKLFSGHV